MVCFSFFKYAAIFFFNVIFCSAPESSRQFGYRKSVREGAVTQSITAFLSCLSERDLVNSFHIKYWLDTKWRPDDRQLLLSYLFQNGQEQNPVILPLGATDEGGYMAVANFKPDRDLAALITGRPESTRPRGWATQSGLLLLKMRTQEEPDIVGLLRFAQSRAATRVKTSAELVRLNEFERMNIVQILRPLLP